MQQLIVDLTISADEYIKQYRHPAAVVTTNSRDGRRIKFPANILRPYVSHTGISGSFEIYFDTAGKFSRIDQLAG
jgi:hypothetical protein